MAPLLHTLTTAQRLLGSRLPKPGSARRLPLADHQGSACGASFGPVQGLALDRGISDVAAIPHWASRGLLVDQAPSRRDTAGVRHWTWPRLADGTIVLMADAASLDERLEHIGSQLDWVRDYL
jgi:hypothetical protein